MLASACTGAGREEARGAPETLGEAPAPSVSPPGVLGDLHAQLVAAFSAEGQPIGETLRAVSAWPDGVWLTDDALLTGFSVSEPAHDAPTGDSRPTRTGVRVVTSATVEAVETSTRPRVEGLRISARREPGQELTEVVLDYETQVAPDGLLSRSAGQFPAPDDFVVDEVRGGSSIGSGGRLDYTVIWTVEGSVEDVAQRYFDFLAGSPEGLSLSEGASLQISQNTSGWSVTGLGGADGRVVVTGDGDRSDVSLSMAYPFDVPEAVRAAQ